MSEYVETDWINEEAPAISGVNLNHLEVGTKDAHEEIEDIAIGNTTVREAATTDKAKFISAASQTVIGGLKAYTITNSSDGQVTGYLDSIVITDPPGNIIDTRATDNLPGVVIITFSDASNAQWYDLYKDGELIATDITSGFKHFTGKGTWDFQVLPNNAFGKGKGIIDSGTARLIPTEPPAMIRDFTASDNYPLRIEFNWSDYEDAYRFDVYEDSNIVLHDARPGDTWVTQEYNGTFSVKAINRLGNTASNTDDGRALSLVPDYISDFIASDDLQNSIGIEFSYARQPATYDLYRAGALLRTNVVSGFAMTSLGGTWDFNIAAVNRVATVPSNLNSGTAIAALYPPETITDFSATDNEVRKVIMNFTHAEGAGTYELYQDDVLINPEIYPGYVLNIEPGTWSFYVKAVNVKGKTTSEPNNGTAIAAFTSVPSTIVDFTASDTLVNVIEINFTPVDDAITYDLFRDDRVQQTNVQPGQFINMFSGTWTFSVGANNPIGNTRSNTEEGTAIAAVAIPVKIEDFEASDNKEVQVEMTFTPSENAASHDLYSGADLLETAIQSGFIWGRESGGPTDYHVRAINFLGYTDSNIDEGTALEATVPPEVIVDFAASDGLEAEIVMTWSTALYASSYDLYRGDDLEEVGITTGYVLASDVTGSWTFHVVANNNYGSTPSNDNEGSSVKAPEQPAEVLDLVASGNYTGGVKINFTADTLYTDSYDLEEDGEIVAHNVVDDYMHSVSAGTRSYRVKGINPAGHTFSNYDMGTSLANVPAPGYINDFHATGGGSDTDARLDGIQISFSPALDATGYNLYDFNEGNNIASDVVSGEVITVGHTEEHSYAIDAVGAGGGTMSNTDEGRVLVPSGSVSYTVPGTHYWVVPLGVASVDINFSGAGGGGGGGQSGESNNDNDGGGGYGGKAGQSDTRTGYFVVEGETITITVGAGGSYGPGGTEGDYHPGIAGHSGGLSEVSGANGNIICLGGDPGSAQQNYNMPKPGEDGEDGIGSGGAGGDDSHGGTGGQNAGGGGGGGGHGDILGHGDAGWDGGPGGDGAVHLSWGD